jgi:hypothetical protein
VTTILKEKCLSGYKKSDESESLAALNRDISFDITCPCGHVVCEHVPKA